MPVLSNPVLPGNALTGSVVNMIAQATKSSALGSVGLSQSTNRKNVAEMFNYKVTNATNFVFPDSKQDWRVRISLAQNADYFYNDPNFNTILSPLTTLPSGLSAGPSTTASLLGSAFGVSTPPRVGVIFPYTPQIQVTHTATYAEQKLTHNNYTNYFYENSAVGAISINADFTVQSIDEGQYLMACIYFFRSVTKMFFGNDPQAGNPPPIVYLNGYGQYYLPNVPCVVTSVTHTMPGDCDYMDIPEPSATSTGYNPQLTKPRLNSTRLPTSSTLALTLQPIYSRSAQSQGFSLNDFARGALVNPVNATSTVTAFGATPGNNPKFATFRPQGGFL